MLIRVLIFLAFIGFVYGDKNIIKTEHYKSMVAMFEQDVESNWANILIGDSHFEFHKWANEYTNLGIAGDTTSGVLHRLSQFSLKHTTNLYLLIGINDIIYGNSLKEIKNNYSQIIDELNRMDIENIYTISVLPVSNSVRGFKAINAKVQKLNQFIKEISTKNYIKYLDVSTKLRKGVYLDPVYTTDGLHLNDKGYKILKEFIQTTEVD